MAPYKPYKRKTKKGRKLYPTKRNLTVKDVKKITKQQIHRVAEEKMVFASQLMTNIIPCSTSGGQFTNVSLTPTLSQGNDSSQRIGNKVNIKYNDISMFFSIKPYDAGTNTWQSPVIVKIWIYSFKTLNAYAAQASNVTDLIANQLFQINNSARGTTKTITDTLFKTNNDYITVHTTRTFSLSTPTSNPASLGFNSDGQPFKQVKIPLTKYMKGTTVFNDVATNPINKNLYMLINTYKTDGSTYLDTERLATYSYVHCVKYEDI